MLSITIENICGRNSFSKFFFILIFMFSNFLLLLVFLRYLKVYTGNHCKLQNKINGNFDII